MRIALKFSNSLAYDFAFINTAEILQSNLDYIAKSQRVRSLVCSSVVAEFSGSSTHRIKPHRAACT